MLVVIAIIGIMLALLLPAIQAAREAARRSQCASQLAQLMLAVTNYEMSHGVYPPGVVDAQGPILSQPGGYHHSWTTFILPYIDEMAAWKRIDRTAGVYDDKNRPVREYTIALLQCPSDGFLAPSSSYCGIHHHVEAPIDANNTGAFFLNSRLAYEDVRDGLTFTIFLSEKLYEEGDLGWMSGARATLRNVGPGVNVTGFAPLAPLPESDLVNSGVLELDAQSFEEFESAKAEQARRQARQVVPPGFVGGPSSRHPGGVEMAMGDGSVRFLSQVTDSRVLASLAHRDDQGPSPAQFYPY